MFCIYEFEVFESDGLLFSCPYDMEGSTHGEDFKKACEMSADWLKTEIEHRNMHGTPLPEATFGNTPRYSGKNIIVALKL